ncbi:MAG: ABC transporter permease [Chloroflexota bacterium]
MSARGRGAANVATIARREYLVRARSRSFVLATVLLVVGVIAIAFLPVIVARLGVGNPTRIAVASTEPGLAVNAAASLSLLLNADAAGSGSSGSSSGSSDAVVTPVADVETGRAAVIAGEYGALLAIARSAAGDLAFTLYSSDAGTGRTAALLRQATAALAVADRLGRLGIAPADQASLFAPPAFETVAPDPSKPGQSADLVTSVSTDMLAFGMTILIFMMIMFYGTWIAQSVVEEKSSRVMEVVLNAATPFQLLAGKVFGVGALALTQYGAVVVAGVVALLLQGPVTERVLGSAAAAMELPQGLTPSLLLAFATFGALGFLLYATLFAAAGSLVSRSEDVNSVIMPLTLLCSAGYIVGTYGAMGLLDIHAPWMIGLTVFPFLSPFMILGRIAVGAAEPWQVAVSVGLLVAAIGASLWVAARIYAVGVLLYGSRPGWRAIWKLLREGM